MATDEITWACETCEGQPTFDHAGFTEHLQTVHGLPKTTTGTRTMLMHADGAKSYSTTYRWQFENFSAQQRIVSQRTGEDAAFWEAMG